MGHSAAVEVMQRRERGAMEALARGSGTEIEDYSDAEFKDLVERRQRKIARLKQLITSTMKEGEHFGKVPGVEKPFCWEPGADEICIHTGWNARLLAPATYTYDGEVLTVTAEVGVFDLSGRLLTVAPRACSTREKRFRKRNGSWKFEDPRECANECKAMAFKRGKIAALLSAGGLKTYFANPNQTTEGDDEGAKIEFWTEAEKTKVYLAAREVGINSKDSFASFVMEVLDHSWIGTGEDVETLLRALDERATAVDGMEGSADSPPAGDR